MNLFFGMVQQSAAEVFVASGGTVTDDGTYRYHTFTSSGTFEVLEGSKDVEYLIVAGGGAGSGAAWGPSQFNRAGGGGAGGLITGTTNVSVNNYSITVGAGGSSGDERTRSNGQDSSAFSQTAIGGGYGGNVVFFTVGSGGSGGGRGVNRNNIGGPIGNGTAGQGNNGSTNTSSGGGGGGGAGSAGSGSSGGAGLNVWGTVYAKGGDANTGFGAGASASPNTGNGGNGAKAPNNPPNLAGGAGGSGIVIVRYLL